MYGRIHEDLSTRLTPPSRKRTVFRGALKEEQDHQGQLTLVGFSNPMSIPKTEGSDKLKTPICHILYVWEWDLNAKKGLLSNAYDALSVEGILIGFVGLINKDVRQEYAL